jgi:hypothetical protein
MLVGDVEYIYNDYGRNECISLEVTTPRLYYAPPSPAGIASGFLTFSSFRGGVVSPTPNPQPGGSGPRIYIHRRQGGPAITLDTAYLGIAISPTHLRGPLRGSEDTNEANTTLRPLQQFSTLCVVMSRKILTVQNFGNSCKFARKFSCVQAAFIL